MMENVDYMIMIELKYLIPLQAREDVLVWGYIRQMELDQDFDYAVVPDTLIKLIMSYFPLKLLVEN